MFEINYTSSLSNNEEYAIWASRGKWCQRKYEEPYFGWNCCREVHGANRPLFLRFLFICMLLNVMYLLWVQDLRMYTAKFDVTYIRLTWQPFTFFLPLKSMLYNWGAIVRSFSCEGPQWVITSREEKATMASGTDTCHCPPLL